MGKISVVINTYNAEQNLRMVLDAVKKFDEIVICDMESSDATCAIAAEYGCKIVNFPKGNITICEPARNAAIQSATNEWVLVVDADELITPELRDYLYERIKMPNCPDALFIPRKNLMIDPNKWSSYPDYQCRFVRKSKVNWPPIIHSKPEIDGKVEYILKERTELAIIHLLEKLSDRIRKINNYTDNEVDRRKGENVSLFKLIIKPWFRFFKSYIIKGGIFRGKDGYIKARNQYFYVYLIMCKLIEHRLNNRGHK